MAIVIMDRPDGPLPPYLEWLGGAPRDVVLLTGRSADELDAQATAGYAGTHYFSSFSGPGVERAVLRIADFAGVSGIVATHEDDLVRVGALRDRIGVPGLGRDDAIALRDLVAQRSRLEAAGIATVRSRPVRRVMDLYWYADREGYPLRVRKRRGRRWPVVAVLEDDAATTGFTEDGLAPSLEVAPSLVMEPAVAGERDQGTASEALCAEVGDALRIPEGVEMTVEAVCTRGGDWLVDTVICDFDGPAAVRVQAGAPARTREARR